VGLRLAKCGVGDPALWPLWSAQDRHRINATPSCALAFAECREKGTTPKMVGQDSMPARSESSCIDKRVKDGIEVQREKRSTSVPESQDTVNALRVLSARDDGGGVYHVELHEHSKTTYALNSSLMEDMPDVDCDRMSLVNHATY